MTRYRSCLEIGIFIPLVFVVMFFETVQVRQLIAAGEMSVARQRNERVAIESNRCLMDENAEGCFTVFLMTFKRLKSAVAAANYYRSCPRVREVRVVWVESATPPIFKNDKGAPITVDVHYPSTSLNTRFKMLKPVSTDSIFSVDDDVRITCRDLEGAHDEWMKQPHRMVGFFPRTIQREGTGSWRYRAFPAVALWRQYHIVLTKAAFLPTRLMEVYSGPRKEVVATRKIVEDHRNCEDIAMQFVSAHTDGQAPLYYSPRDEVVDYGSWMFGLWMSGLSSRRASGQHMLDRSRCVTNLSAIWGNASDPLPAAHDISGEQRWLPAAGWEFVSSDLWAPLLVRSGPPLLCTVIALVCVLLLYQINCRKNQISPTSPSMIFLKAGRCMVVAVLVCIMIFMLDCCKTQGPHPSKVKMPDPACDFNQSLVKVPASEPPKAPQRRLRIAVTSGVYSGIVDGVSLTMNRMVKYMSDLGHEVVVFAPDLPTEHGIPHYVGRVVRVSGLNGMLLGKADYYYATGLGNDARAEIEAFKPDVIHSATPDGAATEALDWAAHRNIPVVCSYHTRFNTYFQYYGWFNFLESAYWRSVRPFFNRCDRVLPPTNYVKDELEQNGVTSGIDLWPRGVDIRLFHPAKRCNGWRQVGEDEVVILFASRIVLEKNLQVYVDVIHRLKELRLPHHSVVVGEGPAREWMQNELPDSRFLGRANEDQLSYAYASSDLFLFPSTTETWGNVVLEAMSSGLPVIGANASGTSALVRHGETGYLCDPKNTTSFVDRVVELVRSPQLRKQLSKNSRKVAEGYTWDRAFNALLDTYGAVIKEKKEKPHTASLD